MSHELRANKPELMPHHRSNGSCQKHRRGCLEHISGKEGRHSDQEGLFPCHAGHGLEPGDTKEKNHQQSRDNRDNVAKGITAKTFRQVAGHQSGSGKTKQIPPRWPEEVSQSPFPAHKNRQADGANQQVDPHTRQPPAAAEKKTSQQDEKILQHQRNRAKGNRQGKVSANTNESGHERGVDDVLQLVSIHKAQTLLWFPFIRKSKIIRVPSHKKRLGYPDASA